ncbi:hypothetical protein HanRHA438_Chr08g0339981 [Helianthus annuus]|nr:hypothetical protein HanRHA438_Chr08g0339981 [Helianthus annuus]
MMIPTTRPCHRDLRCRNVQPFVVIDAYADVMPPLYNLMKNMKQIKYQFKFHVSSTITLRSI